MRYLSVAVALTMIVACSKETRSTGAVSGASQGATTGKVVNWRALIKFLPKAIGAWSSTGPVKGSTRGHGKMTITEVGRRYTRGGSSVYVQITDTTFAPFLRTEFASTTKQESGSGFTNSMKVGGHPAILRWHRSKNRSTVKVLVGARFLVLARVRKAARPDQAAALVGRLALGALTTVR